MASIRRFFWCIITALYFSSSLWWENFTICLYNMNTFSSIHYFPNNSNDCLIKTMKLIICRVVLIKTIHILARLQYLQNNFVIWSTFLSLSLTSLQGSISTLKLSIKYLTNVFSIWHWLCKAFFFATTFHTVLLGLLLKIFRVFKFYAKLSVRLWK